MRSRIFLVAVLAALAAALPGGGAPKAFCNPPAAGDWIVALSCTFQGQDSAPADVVVQPGVTLTLAPGADLDIDFDAHHLRVRDNARVIVQLGAKIR
jgi:hypothetical protein